MKTCPSCNAKLTDDELQAGHCEVCDSDFDPQPPDPQGGGQNYMQTVDGSALPIDLDSDELDFDSFADEVDDRRNNQTIDASDLAATLDSDSVDVEIPSLIPEPPSERAYTQTIEAADLPTSDDSDSIDMDVAPPASEKAYTQTIDSSALPVELDSDSFEEDSPPKAGSPAPPRYNQTIDASQLSEELDSDSVDGDMLPKASSPAPPRYDQTIDASQIPAAADSDSVDFEQGVPDPKQGGIGQTVDGANLNFDDDSDSIDGPPTPVSNKTVADVRGGQTIDAETLPSFDQEESEYSEGSTDATLDSASMPPKSKPGTVSDVRGMQTIDSSAGSVAMPDDGTFDERKYSQTIDSADIVGDESGTLAERKLAQTYDSSVIDDGPKKLDDMWGGDQNAGASPRMTIKGREAPAQSSSDSLVVQRRAFREVSEEHAYGGTADYDLVKKLGEGGMGVVYAGRQASIDRVVAIKMLKPHMAADKGQRNKFLAEAVITGDLDHPNIVPIYDLGANDEGALFYAMKCVKGTPWDDCIGKKSLAENIEILLKACDAVAFGHSRGIIHRDLKPENTMLGGFGEVLVMDWGLALPFGKFEKSRSITPSASMGGTPAYMAPEMATGPFDKMGPASDIYLLGAILYEIVTGTPPHRGKDVMKCLFAAAKNQIVPTDKKGELVDIALKAMATKIEDRYATVQDLQAAIRGYLDHSESIAMSSRATDDLEAAQKSDRYEDYSRAVFGFEEAYELWDGNTRALEGVMLAKLAYAHSALGKGDFDLGSSLLDPDIPDHASLAAEIDKAKRDREARHQRAQTLKQVVIGMAVIGFISAVAVSGVMYSLKTEAVAQSVEAERQKDLALAAKAEEQIARLAAVAAKDEAVAAQEAEEKARLAAVAAKDEAVAAQEAEEKARLVAVAAKDEAVAAQEAEAKARLAAVAAEKEEAIARERAEYEAYVALIGLAAAKIDENAFDRARELLTECKPELRNWEWGRLMHICNQNDSEHNAGAKIDAIAFGPDGKRFVTGGWDGRVRVWNEDGSTIDLPQEGLYVQAVAFSPVADQVATGCDDKSAYLRIWDLKTRQPLRTLQGHTDAITSISYSKDGKRLLTTSFDKTARIWDVETGEQLQALEGHSWWVWDAAFSPDEKWVVTASQDGTCLVWNLSDGKRRAPFSGHQGPVYSVAFGAMETKSAMKQRLESAKLWGEATAFLDQVKRELRQSGKTVPEAEQEAWERLIEKFQLLPNVASGGYDKRVLLWNPDDLKEFDFKSLLAGDEVPPPKFVALDGHTAAVRSVEFSADKKFVLSAGHDNTVKVWTVASASLLKTLRGHGSWVRACAFSPDGQWVLSGGYDNYARLWNIKQYEEVRVMRGRVLEGHRDAIMDARFSRDGHQIATASRDRTVKSWNADTGTELKEFREGHFFLASDSAFFNDNKRLATSAVDNTVRIWNVASGVEIHRLEHTGLAAAVAVSHDDRWIATGSDRIDSGIGANEISITMRAAKIWNAETGELVRTLAGRKVGEGHKAEVTAVAFSPDDRFVYSGDANGAGVLWNRETGDELCRLGWHSSKIVAASFTPRGDRLLTASDDKNVCQWDVSQLAGNPRAVARKESPQWKHPAAVISLDLSRDGSRALTACADGKLRVWDIDSPEAVQSFESVSSPISSAALSRDGKLVVSVHATDGLVRIWDVETGVERLNHDNADSHAILDFNNWKGSVWSARFSNDSSNKSLLTVGGAEAQLWDLGVMPESKVSEIMTFSPHTAVASANFSPDGRWIVTASWDNSARIWNAETGADEFQLLGHKGSVNSAVFSPDGKFVLTASDDETAKLWVWDGKQGTLLRNFDGHEGRVRDATFSADGLLVLTASEDSTARIWTTATGVLVRELKVDTRAIANVESSDAPSLKVACLSAAFSADGRLIITGSDDNVARVWDAETGEMLRQLAGHTAPVTSVAFSPDGRRALTASEDFTAKLWDAGTGKEILNLQGHSQAVTSVTFSDDGRFALTGSRDGSAILWLTQQWLQPVQGE